MNIYKANKNIARFLFLGIGIVFQLCCAANSFADDPYESIWSVEPEPNPSPSPLYRNENIVSDINGDGIDDVAVAAQQAAHGIYLLSGANGAQLWSYGFVQVTGSNSYFLDVHDDLNNDGISDLAVAFTTSSANAIHRVKMLDSATGAVLWTGSVAVPEPFSIRSISDVNHDGVSDVAVGAVGASLYMFDGSSGIKLWNLSSSGDATPVRHIFSISDLNADAVPEIGAGTGQRIFLVSGSNGSLLWTQTSQNLVRVEAIDDTSLITISESFTSEHGGVKRLNGQNGSAVWQYYDACFVAKNGRVVNDSTGDGYQDIAVFLHKLTSCPTAQDQMKLLNGQTGEVVWSMPTPDIGFASDINQLNDANSDGTLDIVVTVPPGNPDFPFPDPLQHKILILNGGDGSILHALDVYQPRSALNVNDLTGDGVDDLIVSSRNRVQLLKGAGTTNQPPVLASVGNRAISEGETIAFDISATDFNGDNLTFTASNLPNGATFTDNHDGTAQFSWPTDYDDAGQHAVMFTVSDGSLNDSETMSINVVNTNRAPVLDPIGAKRVGPGMRLRFTVSAKDPDQDHLVLTAATLPRNATFVDNRNGTGTFSWQTTSNDRGVYTVSFSASDGSVTDSETIQITVSRISISPEAIV